MHTIASCTLHARCMQTLCMRKHLKQALRAEIISAKATDAATYAHE